MQIEASTGFLASDRMLQAPPSHADHHHQHQHHLSRVCGHGHIKKFWLMQTQKETECEDENKGQSTGNAAESKSSPPSAIHQNQCLGYGEHCSDTGDSAVDNEDNLAALYPAINQCSAQSLPVSGNGGSEDNGIPLNLPDEGNRTESLNHRFHSGGASIQKNVVFDDAKSMGAAVVSSPGRSTLSQAPQDIDVTSKALPLIESNNEEPLESCTLPKASPPHKKVESKTRALNYGDTMEEKRMEDIGVRSLSGITISPPSHRKLQSRNKGGLDSTLFDEAKCMETSQERDLSSPKVCTLCGATKTPMWRSGPQGPKSLCNACGIRYKKYRAFSGLGCDASDLTSPNPTSPPPTKALTTKKRKQNFGALLSAEPSQSHKKSKWHQEQLHELVIKRSQADLLREIPSAWKVSSGPASLKKIYGCMPSRFKNFGPLEEHLTVKRVFAKDEEEAAVLLMDLSCGLAF